MSHSAISWPSRPCSDICGNYLRRLQSPFFNFALVTCRWHATPNLWTLSFRPECPMPMTRDGSLPCPKLLFLVRDYGECVSMLPILRWRCIVTPMGSNVTNDVTQVTRHISSIETVRSVVRSSSVHARPHLVSLDVDWIYLRLGTTYRLVVQFNWPFPIV